MQLDGDKYDYRKLKGVSGTAVALLQRQANGLMTVECVEPGPDIKELTDFVTGRQIPLKSELTRTLSPALCDCIQANCTKICKSLPLPEPLVANVAHSAFEAHDRPEALVALAAGDAHAQTDAVPAQTGVTRDIRPPAEPPPASLPSDVPKSTPVMRILLIGCGLCTEKMLNARLRAKGVHIEVVAFIEFGARFDYAKGKFPNAVALYDLDAVIEALHAGELTLPEFDLVFCTLPCTDNTQLKQLNGYPTPAAAHLFTESQLELIDLVAPPLVLNEMVPPRHDYTQVHERLIAEFKRRGYYVAVDLVDACCVGDVSSHHRWFGLASKNRLPEFNVIKASRMGCVPRPLSEILDRRSAVPKDHFWSCPSSAVSTNAPQLVRKLFSCWHQPRFSRSILGHEGALAAVLLAWYFGKHQTLSEVEVGAKSGPQGVVYHNLHDPGLQHVFVLLHAAFRRQGVIQYTFAIGVNCKPRAHGDADQSHRLRIGFGEKSGGRVWFNCIARPQADASHGELAGGVVSRINRSSPSMVVLEPGGYIRFVDSNNILRSKLKATLAHTWGWIYDRVKGNGLCDTTGPAPTFTSHANILVALGHDGRGNFNFRYLTVAEAARMKSFDKETVEYLCSIDPTDAFRLIANAVPGRLLEAVYSAVFRIWSVDNLAPADAFLVDELEMHFGSELGASLRDSAVPFVDSAKPEDAESDRDADGDMPDLADACSDDESDGEADVEGMFGPAVFDPHISKRKHTPKVKTSDWRPMPPSNSRGYAETKWRVNRYHQITHRSKELIENDIIANPGLFGMVPGDSRFMSPCRVCELNKPKQGVRHHAPHFHENELKHAPGEAWMIDIWYAPVKSLHGQYVYFLICCDIYTDYAVVVNLRSLDTNTFIAGLSSLRDRIKEEFDINIRLIVCDHFSSFKERSKLKLFKHKWNCKFELLSPYVHQPNRAENAIKILRNKAVVLMQNLSDKFINGKRCIPEQWIPESLNMASAIHNQGANSSMLRKFGRNSTPRARISENTARDLPLGVFGEAVSFTLPNKIKSRLARVEALYLHPANYDADRLPHAASTRSSVVVLVGTGKKMTTEQFSPLGFCEQAKVEFIGKTMGNGNVRPEPDIADSFERPKREAPLPSMPRRASRGTFGVGGAKPSTEVIDRPDRVDSTPIAHTRTDTAAPAPQKLEYLFRSPQSKHAEDNVLSPGVPSPDDMPPSSPTDLGDFATPGDNIDTPSVAAPPTPGPGASTPRASASPRLVQSPILSPMVSPVGEYNGPPRAGETFRIRNNDDTWVDALRGNRTLRRYQVAPKQFLSESTPGKQLTLKSGEAIVIDSPSGQGREGMVSTYDIREHRHGPRTDPNATWHRTPSKYASLHTSMEEAAFIADALHKPTLTTFLTDSGEAIETIYNIDTTGYAQPKVSTLKRADNRVTLLQVPGFSDRYTLLDVSRRSKSDKADVAATALLFLTAVSFAGITSKQNAVPDVVKSTLLQRKKRHDVKAAYLMMDPKAGIDQAVDVASYGEHGGTVESLRYEMQLKHLEPDGTGRLTWTSFNTFLNSETGGGDELYSAFFSGLESQSLSDRANSFLVKSQNAAFLFGDDECLVGCYDTIGRHFKSLYDSSDSLDHLPFSHYDEQEEKCLQVVEECCLNRYADLEVAVQLSCLTTIIGEKDLHYEPETMIELNQELPELRKDYVKAIVREFAGLCRNDCFSLEVVPENRSPLSTRLVLKVKRKADGTFAKFKARAVVRGFMAKIGVDYYSVYCPMASLNTCRMVMALGLKNNVPIHHADIPQAFIQSELDRDIYVTLPPGISVAHDLLHKVQAQNPSKRIGIKLLKSLYGLKQAPMLWNKMLNEVMVKAGFTRSKSDTCLYVSHNNGKWCACAAFVDDIVVTGTDSEMIAKLRETFDSTFKGEGQWDESINSFLGMHIEYDQFAGKLSFSVRSKIEDLFEKFDFLGNPPKKRLGRDLHAPYLPQFEHPPEDDELDEEEMQIKENFASIVGSCIYFSITARPDIATIVNKACKGMHGPSKVHIMYVKALIRYLRNHKNTNLSYTREGSSSPLLRSLSSSFIELDVLDSAPVVGFSDANHLDKIVDGGMYSTSGNCFLLFGNLVQWSSKRQTIHASSSMQSELIAACTASDSAVWFHAMMVEFPFLFDLDGKVPPVPLLIDNQACLSVANHPENSSRTRHIALREFRIRDYVEGKQVRPLWCPGSHNLADHFTKLLERLVFQRLNFCLGMSGMSEDVPMPPLLEPKKPNAPEGFITEYVRDGDARSWKLFPAYGHSSSRMFYDAFICSDGIIPVECDA